MGYSEILSTNILKALQDLYKGKKTLGIKQISEKSELKLEK